MTAPTPDPVEALAKVYAAHLPTWTEDGFACGACEHLFVPGGAGSYSAFAVPDEIKALIREHQAIVVLDAIDAGRVPGVARVEVAKAEAEGHYHRGVQTGLKAAQVAVRAAKGEALREAKGDIKARIETFRGLDAHPEYMAALNDTWGLVANRERDALADAPAPQQVDAEPVALTEEERRSLGCHCWRVDGVWHHVAGCRAPAAERILRDRLAARTAPADQSVERDLWWGYLCPAISNIGALKQAQSDLIALGADWAEAGRILSRVQKFYVDAAYQAARRYVDEVATSPAPARDPLEDKVRALVERETAEPCERHPQGKAASVECDFCTAYEVDAGWIDDLRALLPDAATEEVRRG